MQHVSGTTNNIAVCLAIALHPSRQVMGAAVTVIFAMMGTGCVAAAYNHGMDALLKGTQVENVVRGIRDGQTEQQCPRYENLERSRHEAWLPADHETVRSPHHAECSDHYCRDAAVMKHDAHNDVAEHGNRCGEEQKTHVSEPDLRVQLGGVRNLYLWVVERNIGLLHLKRLPTLDGLCITQLLPDQDGRSGLASL
eukprot:CAMPEP_0182600208 /NCGR_PEP_ID=MMETSP1324-20130603/90872_1 /TAXON_ID=236786 /ORGANISM="Florenciella sp., Strain RCC1587" /LENGTH=195 /DNA_ID=CAMNT_0024818119 /DNA_START=930 /DNA_END=1516 /DNA_ORIENTATION=+